MNPAPAPALASVKSMTGYAQARMEQDGWLLAVSLRSVNHRFLDVRVRVPEGLEAFEPRIRQLLRDAVRRGHVDVTVHFQGASSAGNNINRAAAEAYLRAVEALRKEFHLSQEPDLVALLRLPGVVFSNFAPGALLAEDAADRLAAPLTACLQQALQQLDQMRQAEGRALAAEMRALLATMATKVAAVEALAIASRPAYAQRLKSRIGELLGELAPDPARLAQEAAILAERADVTEELARLKSHLDQFHAALDGAGEIGKKLDFLLQEMQREANTFLSKTPGLGPDGLAMTEAGLQLKSEIEKLREQAQNVE